MIKVLSIAQPWAQMIANGIVDVANLDFDTDYRGKVVICANSEPVPADFFDNLCAEWAMAITNEQFFGNLPSEEVLPTNTLLGVVDLVDCQKGETDGFWDGPADAYKWRFQNAEKFEINVKGDNYPDGFSEADIFLLDLPEPAKAELTYPRMDNGTLVIPVADAMFWDMPKVKDYSFYLVPQLKYIQELFPDMNIEAVPISNIRFVHAYFKVFRMATSVTRSCEKEGKQQATVMGVSKTGAPITYDYLKIKMSPMTEA